MLKYFLKRLLAIIPVLVVVSILACGFVRLLPGDPARMMAGQDADAETIEKLRRDLGLDRPLPAQYVTYMAKVFRGDLGMSLKSKLPVFDEIALRYPPTMILAVAGMAWSVLFGVFFGAIAAIYSGKWQDYTAMMVSVSGISIPQFWLGLSVDPVFFRVSGLASGYRIHRKNIGADSAVHYPGRHRGRHHGPVYAVGVSGRAG